MIPVLRYNPTDSEGGKILMGMKNHSLTREEREERRKRMRRHDNIIIGIIIVIGLFLTAGMFFIGYIR